MCASKTKVFSVYSSLATIMGPRRSKIKKTSKSIMNSVKGESRYYTCAAVLGICIACFPLLVVASQQRDSLVGASDPKLDLGTVGIAIN